MPEKKTPLLLKSSKHAIPGKAGRLQSGSSRPVKQSTGVEDHYGDLKHEDLKILEFQMSSSQRTEKVMY